MGAIGEQLNKVLRRVATGISSDDRLFGEFGGRAKSIRYGSLWSEVVPISDGALTLNAGHHGKILDFAIACAVTVPPGLPRPFVAGLSQGGAGQVTVVEGAGVTVDNADASLVSEGQFVMLTLVAFPGTNTYRLYGRMG